MPTEHGNAYRILKIAFRHTDSSVKKALQRTAVFLFYMMTEEYFKCHDCSYDGVQAFQVLGFHRCQCHTSQTTVRKEQSV